MKSIASQNQSKLVLGFRPDGSETIRNESDRMAKSSQKMKKRSTINAGR
jgi:hypothetical protein